MVDIKHTGVFLELSTFTEFIFKSSLKKNYKNQYSKLVNNNKQGMQGEKGEKMKRDNMKKTGGKCKRRKKKAQKKKEWGKGKNKNLRGLKKNQRSGTVLSIQTRFVSFYEQTLFYQQMEIVAIL